MLTCVIKHQNTTHTSSPRSRPSRAPTGLACACLFLFHGIQQGIWYAQVFYGASSYITFLEFPEPIAVCARLIDLSQSDVHEVVAVDKVAVERFTIFQFYKHGLVLGR